MTGWMVLWSSGPDNVDEVYKEHLVYYDWRHRYGARGNHNLMIFPSRKLARAFAKEEYGYIVARRDLRKYPHNWHPARVVKVHMEVSKCLKPLP